MDPLTYFAFPTRIIAISPLGVSFLDSATGALVNTSAVTGLADTTPFVFEASDLAVIPGTSNTFAFRLSTGEALLDLSRVFSSYLREYAQRVLVDHLPQNHRAQGQSTFSQVTAMLKEGGNARLSRKELSTACLLLNSADYCIDTISALEEKLIEKANVEYKAQIGGLHA